MALVPLLPASAQGPLPPEKCTIEVFGGSCQFLCVAGKTTSIAATGVSATVKADCPGAVSDTSCTAGVGSCAGTGRIAEGGVGTCTATGTFVYRASCNGAA